MQLHIKYFQFSPFAENTYILYNDAKQAYIIDPGMYSVNEQRQFVQFIDNNDLKPIKIINTHCHLDHIFGVHFLQEKYNIPFAIHPLEEQTLQLAEISGQLYGTPVNPIPKVNEHFAEGDTIVIGDSELKVLFVPGHSVGHVAFYCAAQNFVINGDVLFQQSIGRTDLPGGNHETLIQSIHTQLLTLPEHTMVYCGHGPATTIGIEKMNNPFLR